MSSPPSSSSQEEYAEPLLHPPPRIEAEASRASLDLSGAPTTALESAWEKRRQEWLKPRAGMAARMSQSKGARPGIEVAEIDVSAICEALVGPTWPDFGRRVNLADIVRILIELWEAEGLFD